MLTIAFFNQYVMTALFKQVTMINDSEIQTSSGHLTKMLNFFSVAIMPGPSVSIQRRLSLYVSSRSLALFSGGAISIAFTETTN